MMTTEDLEQHCCELTGRKHAVLVERPAIALEQALRFLVETRLETIAVSALAGPAAAMAKDVGLRSGLLDIDPRTLSPALETVDALYATSPFQILLLTWPAGFIAGHAAELQQWAAEHRVVIVEDASAALGSLSGNRPAGAFGDLSVLGLGLAGVLLTDAGEVAQGVPETLRLTATTDAETALKALAKTLAWRRTAAKQYDPYVRLCGLTSAGERGGESAPNVRAYPVLVPTPERRDEFLAFGRRRGLGLGMTGDALTAECPGALAFAQRHVGLPMGDAMSAKEVERVGGAMLEFFVGG